MMSIARIHFTYSCCLGREASVDIICNISNRRNVLCDSVNDDNFSDDMIFDMIFDSQWDLIRLP